jgi:hypothetical protein
MGVPDDKNEVIQVNDPERTLVYALVKHNSIELMFQSRESLTADMPYFAGKTPGASVSFYFEVDDINSYYDTLKGKIETVKDKYTTWYGMREFYISDCNGYILGFACRE